MWFKTLFDLKTDSQSTYLGVLWWFLEPLAFLTVYYVVFGVIMKSKTPNFIMFLFIGLVAWRWFNSSLLGSGKAISNQKKLMKEVYVSKLLFPLTIVLVDTIKFIIVFACVLAIMFIMHNSPTIHWICVVPILLVQAFLILGVSFCFAGITPFFPDVQNLIKTTIRGLMFLSGVFFDIPALSPHIAHYLMLNPIADIIIDYRAVVIHHTWPNWELLGYALLFAIVMNAIGVWLINKNDRIYPKVCI